MATTFSLNKKLIALLIVAMMAFAALAEVSADRTLQRYHRGSYSRRRHYYHRRRYGGGRRRSNRGRKNSNRRGKSRRSGGGSSRSSEKNRNNNNNKSEFDADNKPSNTLKNKNDVTNDVHLLFEYGDDGGPPTFVGAYSDSEYKNKLDYKVTTSMEGGE